MNHSIYFWWYLLKKIESSLIIHLVNVVGYVQNIALVVVLKRILFMSGSLVGHFFCYF